LEKKSALGTGFLKFASVHLSKSARNLRTHYLPTERQKTVA